MAQDNQSSDGTAMLSSFNATANLYDRHIGRATRLTVDHILRILDPLPRGTRVLDIACGTGAFTEKVLAIQPNVQIDAVDKSSAMTDILNSRVRQNSWSDRVTVHVMDGQKLDFPDASFNLSITLFGIFFYENPNEGAREIFRSLKPGGQAVVTSWKYHGLFPALDEIEEEVRPRQKFTRPPYFTPWRKSEKMEETLKRGGFKDVEIRCEKVMFYGYDFDDLVFSSLVVFNSFIGDGWTEEEKKKLEPATRAIFERRPDIVEFDGGKKGLECEVWIGIARK